MTQPGSHNQYNQPYRGGKVYASQGNQNIYQQTTVHPGVSRKGRAIAFLVAIAVDVAYFFYGMMSYTRGASNAGDTYRAIGFLVLLGITGTLLRRLFRSY